MNDIKVTYRISVRDYHMAVYYASAIRYRTAIKILVVSGFVALTIHLGSLMGSFPLFMLPAYLFLGYLIWFLFKVAMIEHSILKYAKSKESILGKEMSVTFSKGMMRIDTPYNGQSSTCPIDKLACAFEMSDIFLIYFNGEQTCIIPTRAFSGGDRAALRSLLLNTLKERFDTRFGYDSLMPRRKASIFPFKK